ncbi:cytochrome c550 [Aquibacillus albus]|uniref:Cytochrome c550 n=1 Tax=Aquibacillus albus TaxID=1168171 RepID=A0ABS2MUT6_9BACI|nr:cytochrome c [Aquibacillus albus]MBM7569639.1 cytochrome c550 [Aquibacillus albus]
MKRNPVIPYAIIAVLGILAMIILAVVGLDQQEKIELAHENGGEQTDAEPREPEAIAQSCIGCHGTDLAGGGSAPSLQDVGNKYTQEEILDIIKNGIPGTSMPSMVPTISNEEAEVLASWLAENNK